MNAKEAAELSKKAAEQKRHEQKRHEQTLKEKRDRVKYLAQVPIDEAAARRYFDNSPPADILASVNSEGHSVSIYDSTMSHGALVALEKLCRENGFKTDRRITSNRYSDDTPEVLGEALEIMWDTKNG